MWLSALGLVVEQGHLVWPIGAALCLYWSLRRSFGAANRMLSRHARAQVRAMPEPTTVAGLEGKEGAATLLGTLRCDGPCGRFEDGEPAAVAAATPVQEPRSPLAVTARAGKLVLVSGKDRILLEGDVTLLVGTEERWLGRRRPRAVVRDRIEAAATSAPDELWKRPLVLRSIEPGARVVVRGIPEKRTEGAPGWVMRGADAIADDDGGGTELPRTLSIMSVDPPWVRLPLSMRPLARGLLTAAIAFGVSFALPPEVAFRLTGHEGRPDAAVSDETMEPITTTQRALTAVALTAPHRRDAALRGLANQLHAQAEYDDAMLDELEAVHLLDGRPELLLDRLFDLGHLRRVADVASERREHGVAGFAWVGLGRLGRASDAFERGVTTAELSQLRRHAAAHLLAGSPERARAALQRLAASSPADAPSAECLVLALAARDDDEARDQLMRRDREPACILLSADALEGDARTALLVERAGRLTGTRWCTIATLLRVEVDPEHEVPECAQPFQPELRDELDASDATLSRREGMIGVSAGLEAAALRSLRDRRSRRSAGRRLQADLAMRAAVLDAWTGQQQRARRWLAHARNVARGGDVTPFLDPELVTAALEAREGSPVRAEVGGPLERVGSIAAHLAAGDGAELAHALHVPEPTTATPERPQHSLLARADAEHLDRWLRGSSLGSCDGWGALGGSHTSWSVCDAAVLVTDAANRARVARAIDDRDAAEELERIATALGRALRTRRYSVHVALLAEPSLWVD